MPAPISYPAPVANPANDPMVEAEYQFEVGRADADRLTYNPPTDAADWQREAYDQGHADVASLHASAAPSGAVEVDSLPYPYTAPMPRTLRFPFALEAGSALVSVESFEGSHSITSAVSVRTRRNLPMSAADLDAVEAVLETPETVAVEALDVMTGGLARFAVSHVGGTVFAVRYADGVSVRPGAEQFTETTEAFAIDRALSDMESEADARHDAVSL
ncbi:hypothetical protein [Rubrivirga sp.]|uniref:hypothetical protein n=1 Tax=Rubrivirga sp. TaxID=1885344 RepID=UPI003C77339F